MPRRHKKKEIQIRTKRREGPPLKRRWTTNRQFNGKQHILEQIVTNKSKARTTAKYHRARGKNARVVTSKKARQGYNVNIQTGPKKGAFAIYTKPKKGRK